LQLVGILFPRMSILSVLMTSIATVHS